MATWILASTTVQRPHVFRMSNGIPCVAFMQNTGNFVLYKGNGVNPTGFQLTINSTPSTTIGSAQFQICQYGENNLILIGKEAPSMGERIFAHRINMLTNTFGTAETVQVLDYSNSASGNYLAACADANGNVHVAYADQSSNMGSTYRTIYYVNDIGGSWGTKVEIYGKSVLNQADGNSYNGLYLNFNNQLLGVFHVLNAGQTAILNYRAYIGNQLNATSFSQGIFESTASNIRASSYLKQITNSGGAHLIIASSSVNSQWRVYYRKYAEPITTWASSSRGHPFNTVNAEIYGLHQIGDRCFVEYAHNTGDLYYSQFKYDNALLSFPTPDIQALGNTDSDFDQTSYHTVNNNSQFWNYGPDGVNWGRLGSRPKFDIVWYDSTGTNWYFAEQKVAPTITLNTADSSSFSDTTPTLEFTGDNITDEDILEYDVQVMTAADGLVEGSTATQYSSAFTHIGSQVAHGQSFTGNGGKLSRMTWRIGRDGSSIGFVRAELYAHSGTFGTSSIPTGSALATSEILTLESLGAIGATDFNFDGNYTLVNGTEYVAVLRVLYGSGGGAFFSYDGTALELSGNRSVYSSLSQTWTPSAGEDCTVSIYAHTVLLDRSSDIDTSEFVNTVNGGDIHPFNDEEKIAYTVPTPHVIAQETTQGSLQNSYNNNQVINAQTILGDGGYITSLEFYIRKVGSPTGNITFTINQKSAQDTTSTPTSTILLTIGTVDISTLSTTIGWVEVVLTEPYKVNDGLYVAIQMQYTGGDASNYLEIGNKGFSSYSDGVYHYKDTLGGGWTTIALTSLTFRVNSDESLSEGTYYWRARAKRGELVGDWATIRSFDISGGPNVIVTPAPVNVAAAIVEPTVTAVQNVSFTASALTAAFAIVAPMVGISVNETPAPVNASFSIVEPVVTAEKNANFDATALISNFSIIEPVVTAIENVDFTPGVLTANLAIIEPTVTTVTNSDFTATQIPINSAIVEPSVSLGASFAATQLSNALAIQEPVVNIDSNINSGLLTSNFSILEPTIVTATPANFDATVIPVNFAIQEPALNLDCIVSVAQIPSSFAILEPAVNIDAGYTAAQIPANFTIVEPTVTAEQNSVFNATQIPVNFAIQEPTVQTDAIHTATQIPVNFAIVEPAVNIDAGFTAAILSNSFAIVEPVVTGELNALIEPTALNGALAIVEPTVSGVSNFTADLLSSSFGIIEPVVTAEGNVNFDAPLLGSLFSIQEPVVSLPVTVTPTIIGKTPVTVSQASYDSTSTSNNTNLVGQSFFVAGFDVLAPDYIDFVLYAQGNPTLDIRAYIYSLDGSNNLNALLSTSPTIIAASSLTGTPANYRFFFDKAIYTENIAIVLDWINVGTNNGGNKVHFHFQSTDLYANGNYIANSTANAGADAAFMLSIAAYNFIIVEPTVEIGVVRFYAPVLNSSFAIVAPQVQSGADDGFTATQLPVNFAVQEPTVTGESNFVATEIPVNFAVVEPAISGDSSFVATQIPVNFSILEPVINIDSNVNSGLLTNNFAIIEPTVSGQSNINAGLLNAALSIQEPAVSIDVDVQSGLLNANLAIIEPAVQTNVNFNAAVLSGAFAIIEPSVNIDAEFSATALNSNFANIEPVVTGQSNTSVSPINAAFSVIAPTVTAGGSVQVMPVPRVVVSAIVEPAISTDANVSVSLLQSTFAIIEPVVSIDADFAATVLNASFAINEPVINIDAFFAPALLNANIGINEPTISGEANATADLLQSTISIVEPSVQTDANVQISVIPAVLAIIEPSISAGGNVSINVAVINFAVSIVGPTTQTDSNVFPGTLNANAAIVEPAVNIDSDNSANVLAGTFGILEPTISAGGNVVINVTAISASIAIQGPIVNIDVETTVSQVSGTFGIIEPIIGVQIEVLPAPIGMVIQIQEPTISTVYVTPTETIDEVSLITTTLNVNSYITSALNLNSNINETLILKSILDG